MRTERIGVSITGTGLFAPPETINNAELVASLNESVTAWNAAHHDEIGRGLLTARALPDEEFIAKSSGIESRHVIEKSGVLDPRWMRPRVKTRPEDEIGIQAEMALPAAHEALTQARRAPADVDAVIVGCSNLQRAYPAVAIEVQDALGARGWAYDMNVACSSATFALQAGVDALRNGSASCVLVLNPEIMSGHTNFELRDFHFIFGDACTAMVLERTADAVSDSPWSVMGTLLATKFSNNIRNDAGFLNPSEVPPREPHELLFRQNGRQVFREVCPMVAEHILEQLAALELGPGDVRRFWLHQANVKMNRLIAKSVLGRTPRDDEAPMVLDEYANTSSAGSVIAFHHHRDDLQAGDVGVLCSFGAGYSVGSVVVQRSH